MSNGTTPEFRASTADQVGKQLGLHTRKLIESGAATAEIVGIVMRTGDGYVGTIGSKLELLSQMFQADPEASERMYSDLREGRPGPGFVPFIAIDSVDQSWGIEWVGPFPNAPGGEA